MDPVKKGGMEGDDDGLENVRVRGRKDLEAGEVCKGLGDGKEGRQGEGGI